MDNTLFDNLKIGDEVYYDPDSYGSKQSILRVDKVTPTMIIAGTKRFRINGYLIQKDSGYHFPKIKLLTPELRNHLIKIRLVEFIGKCDFELLDIERLEEIKRIIVR